MAKKTTKRKSTQPKVSAGSQVTTATAKSLGINAKRKASEQYKVSNKKHKIEDNSHEKLEGKPLDKVVSASVPSEKPTDSSNDSGLLSLINDLKWRKALEDQMNEPYFIQLEQRVLSDYSDAKKEVFPSKALIFNSLNLTPLDQVKVVIIGQDPYHDNGQAHGLSFSVPHGVAIPPSLRNIYKELNQEGYTTPAHGCLEEWAKRGVLLLNATLTVEAHKANSHSGYGWQNLTDVIIGILSEHLSGIVFLLWGGFAHKKAKLISNRKHYVIKSAHPSPLSFTKFMNCNCFNAANNALKKLSKEPIDWSLA